MDTVHEGGEELINLIGEPDKPEVEKNVEDADATWNDVSSKCDTRQQILDDALRKATLFHDELLVRVTCHDVRYVTSESISSVKDADTT